eukprot:TRINITY_DN1843_c1_g1_i2.p1 TRINITY_DN1843_c1_g1~~TRINITY_DN1843_c1_g1_i2.p1  ORF type:complete len:1549 (+),score=142.87 TRINITY_DN1843_c1_g1_i2:375-4649(+)
MQSQPLGEVSLHIGELEETYERQRRGADFIRRYVVVADDPEGELAQRLQKGQLVARMDSVALVSFTAQHRGGDADDCMRLCKMDQRQLRRYADAMLVLDQSVDLTPRPTVSSQAFQKQLDELADLPIKRHLRAICSAVECNDVTIVSAPTGTGKSTLVPRALSFMESGKHSSERRKVLVSQPRREAAKHLCKRVRDDIGKGGLERTVGYEIGRDSNFDSGAHLVFCTAGSMLQRLQTNRFETFGYFVLDEVHDRTVEADFVMAHMTRVLSWGGGVKLVLMSATADTESLQEYWEHHRPGKVRVVQAGDVAESNYDVYYADDVDWCLVAAPPRHMHVEPLLRKANPLHRVHETVRRPSVRGLLLHPSAYHYDDVASMITESEQRKRKKILKEWAGVVHWASAVDVVPQLLATWAVPTVELSHTKRMRGRQRWLEKVFRDEDPGECSLKEFTRLCAKYAEETVPLVERLDCIAPLVVQLCRVRPLAESIMIFLPGIHDQRKVRDQIETLASETGGVRVRLYILHSTSPATQTVIEKPEEREARLHQGIRKIILSTAVAESSITISDVHVVVDSGLARYPVRRVLVTVPESQDAAVQRAGRCGRCGVRGTVIRLCTRAEFEMLRKSRLPEILRGEISYSVLKLMGQHMHDTFDLFDRLMEAPSGAVLEQRQPAVEDPVLHTAFRELECSGYACSTVEGQEEGGTRVRYGLTTLGAMVRSLPFEPQLSRFVVLGCVFRVGIAAVHAAAVASLVDVAADTSVFGPYATAMSAGTNADPIAYVHMFRKFARESLSGADGEERALKWATRRGASPRIKDTLSIVKECMHTLKKFKLLSRGQDAVSVEHLEQLSYDDMRILIVLWSGAGMENAVEYSPGVLNNNGPRMVFNDALEERFDPERSVVFELKGTPDHRVSEIVKRCASKAGIVTRHRVLTENNWPTGMPCTRQSLPAQVIEATRYCLVEFRCANEAGTPEPKVWGVPTSVWRAERLIDDAGWVVEDGAVRGITAVSRYRESGVWGAFTKARSSARVLMHSRPVLLEHKPVPEHWDRVVVTEPRFRQALAVPIDVIVSRLSCGAAVHTGKHVALLPPSQPGMAELVVLLFQDCHETRNDTLTNALGYPMPSIARKYFTRVRHLTSLKDFQVPWGDPRERQDSSDDESAEPGSPQASSIGATGVFHHSAGANRNLMLRLLSGVDRIAGVPLHAIGSERLGFGAAGCMWTTSALLEEELPGASDGRLPLVVPRCHAVEKKSEEVQVPMMCPGDCTYRECVAAAEPRARCVFCGAPLDSYARHLLPKALEYFTVLFRCRTRKSALTVFGGHDESTGLAVDAGGCVVEVCAHSAGCFTCEERGRMCTAASVRCGKSMAAEADIVRGSVILAFRGDAGAAVSSASTQNMSLALACTVTALQASDRTSSTIELILMEEQNTH